MKTEAFYATTLFTRSAYHKSNLVNQKPNTKNFHDYLILFTLSAIKRPIYLQ
ncbi:hypothetical protein PEPS_08270 [Persicobacter psychrovividus]|uniref:Uncharacterized protein n=1 Tax=Persicobacter psychrovividus TaxID=387638 RepID=A0ABM7VCR0_9BACT|nr:hypothetical protein PEPS_08270 [Persicobacter psychrovividus]